MRIWQSHCPEDEIVLEQLTRKKNRSKPVVIPWICSGLLFFRVPSGEVRVCGAEQSVGTRILNIFVL